MSLRIECPGNSGEYGRVLKFMQCYVQRDPTQTYMMSRAEESRVVARQPPRRRVRMFFVWSKFVGN